MADSLKRRLGPWLLTAYGVGIMVGAGIYVLVGVAAGEAGVFAPLSFFLAALVVLPTALSYAELSARIPEAAGESAYVAQGLGSRWLALLVGLIIVAAGIVSAAAVLRGGVGYLTSIIAFDPARAMIGAGLALTFLAILGALESVVFAVLLTLAEVLGLVLVIGAGIAAAPVAGWVDPGAPVWSGVVGASVFAFFAFIGFEDMVNMAEEARDPGRTMPRALLGALALTALLYALVTLAAVRAVPVETLAASPRPLALVWQAGSGQSPDFLSAIAVAAALNGVLAQIIMAARVLFGLGRRHRGLGLFHRAHPRLGTPVLASLLVGGMVVVAALSLPVARLAEYATLALLAVFVLVNGALIGLKRGRAPGALSVPPSVPFSVPALVPWLGIALSLGMLAINLARRVAA